MAVRDDAKGNLSFPLNVVFVARGPGGFLVVEAIRYPHESCWCSATLTKGLRKENERGTEINPPGRKHGIEKQNKTSFWGNDSRQIIATSAEVTPNGGPVRESPQNPRTIQV